MDSIVSSDGTRDNDDLWTITLDCWIERIESRDNSNGTSCTAGGTIESRSASQLIYPCISFHTPAVQSTITEWTLLSINTRGHRTTSRGSLRTCDKSSRNFSCRRASCLDRGSDFFSGGSRGLRDNSQRKSADDSKGELHFLLTMMMISLTIDKLIAQCKKLIFIVISLLKAFFAVVGKPQPLDGIINFQLIYSWGWGSSITLTPGPVVSPDL